MAYTALYRKFRPDEFEEVKGQEHIVRTLRNQIRTGRIGHAYLFTGTRGTGKTTIAKILAKAVNCENPKDGSPCNHCATCQAIANGNSMNVIEIDAASNNSVDDIRQIVDEVLYSPTQGKFKVYIIDEVHMLSVGAFNALLKTLEEPPSYVIFILATTEVHKIPITILSRCQRYDFRRITVDTITKRLFELSEREEIEAEEKALRYIAKAADGSMRDALSLYDQCIAFYFGQKLSYDMVLTVLGAVDIDIFHQLFDDIIRQDITSIMELLETIMVSGKELSQLILDFTWYLRNILLLQTSAQATELVDVSSENMETLKEMANRLSAETVMRYIRILSDLSNQMRYATQKRVLIEIALIKMCRPQMETLTNLESLKERITNLEMQIETISNVEPMPLKSQTMNSNVIFQEKQKQEIKQEIIMESFVSEDLKEVIRQWEAIKSHLSLSLKSMLGSAVLSIGENNQLLLLLPTKTAEGFVNTPKHIEEIENTIEKIIQKKVSITAKVLESKDTNVKDLDINALNIHMEIEMED